MRPRVFAGHPGMSYVHGGFRESGWHFGSPTASGIGQELLALAENFQSPPSPGLLNAAPQRQLLVAASGAAVAVQEPEHGIQPGAELSLKLAALNFPSVKPARPSPGTGDRGSVARPGPDCESGGSPGCSASSREIWASDCDPRAGYRSHGFNPLWVPPPALGEGGRTPALAPSIGRFRACRSARCGTQWDGHRRSCSLPTSR